GTSLLVDLLWGKVSYSSALSQGWGPSFGLDVAFNFLDDFRVALSPNYHMLRLSRKMDGSGSIVDPNPATFTQTIWFAGLGVYLGYRFIGGGSDETGKPDTELNWWADIGAEYLYPLSG